MVGSPHVPGLGHLQAVQHVHHGDQTNQSAVSPDIHQSAPVFAVWTSTQNNSLHSLYVGKLLNHIRYHKGQLAAGSTDCHILKLLQSSVRELRPLLVFIWAKILAVDSSCQQDLVRDQSHKYSLTMLP